MATGLIQRVQIDDGDMHYIAPTVYGVCNTAANVAAKTVSIGGFELITGTTIYIKFASNNTAASPTLNVNNTGAKDIVLADGEDAGTDDATTGWFANSIVMFTYDGTNWVRSMGYNTDTTYTILSTADITTGTSEVGQLISAKVLKDSLSELLTHIDLSELDLSFTVAGREWSSGDVITRAQLLSDLELSNAMHFIGSVAPNSANTPSDGLNGIPTISGLSSYTPAAGDVVIDADDSREYIYSSAGTWELLGQDASTTYTISIGEYERITGITQASDRTITVTKASIGILPVQYGGTGVDTFNANEVIISNNPSVGEDIELTSRAYKDIQTANAILNSSNNFVTERYIYYGLPTINHTHNYTSSTEIYVPLDAGEANHILISAGGTNAPVWSTVATLESNSTTDNVPAYDTLTLGNAQAFTSTSAHSQGRLRLYSSGITYTEIMSQSGSSNIFYLPAYNGDMYAVHAPSNLAVGSATQPVYVAANGQVQALTFTPNRLYYSTEADNNSATSSSFEATNHYSTETTLAINDASTTYTGSRPDHNLYVNGTTYFNGDVFHNGITYFANPSAADITNGTAYYINNLAVEYLTDIRADKVRLHENWIGFYQNNNADGTCYGTIEVPDATHMNLHLNNNTAANYFDFNGALVPTIHNRYDIGSSSYRWKDLYLEGDLRMQDMGSSVTASSVSNKITWSGSGDGAEIYYQVDSANNGRLFINTINDNSCLVALAYNDTAMAYFNNSTPSFYPVTTGAGSLGLSTNRWGALYLGNADDYGDLYQPIYWHNGLPAITYPVQYFTWTINSGNTGVTLTGTDIFTVDTYNVTLVVVSGEENLNGPLTWTSSANTFRIQSSAATSGAVSGYAIVARGADITSSLSSSQLS